MVPLSTPRIPLIFASKLVFYPMCIFSTAWSPLLEVLCWPFADFLFLPRGRLYWKYCVGLFAHPLSITCLALPYF